MGSQRLNQGLNPYSFACLELKRGVNFGTFSPKLMGSGSHCSKIDEFPGTHANGATIWMTLGIYAFSSRGKKTINQLVSLDSPKKHK